MGTQKLVVLTGAGISAESGVATFRDRGGLWEEHRIEEVASPDGFRADPELVHRFYNQRRRQLPSVAPNAAHRALARLAERWPGQMVLVTQNVDDLHERALSEVQVPESFELIHMHGELTKARCSGCGTVVEWTADLSTGSICPECFESGRLRPHIVWFGEAPIAMPWILQNLKNCQLFAAIGTSGNVYPAAGFVDLVRQRGKAHTIELNLERSQVSDLFHECRTGPATSLVPEWVDEILSSG
ncbi:MAG: NAD-dependent deacylase [Pirellulales bacterium]